MSTPDQNWWEAEAKALSSGHAWMVQAIAAALAAAYQQGREDQRKESEPIPQSYQEFLAKFYPSGI